MINPLFRWTFGWFLWNSFHTSENVLVIEKFNRITQKMSILYGIACITLSYLVPKALPYTIWFILQEFVIERGTKTQDDRWVSLMYVNFYLILTFWYVHPILLIVLSQTKIDFFLSVLCLISWYLVTPLIPIYILPFMTISTLLLLPCKRTSILHCLRLIQAFVWWYAALS